MSFYQLKMNAERFGTLMNMYRMTTYTYCLDVWCIWNTQTKTFICIILWYFVARDRNFIHEIISQKVGVQFLMNWSILFFFRFVHVNVLFGICIFVQVNSLGWIELLKLNAQKTINTLYTFSTKWVNFWSKKKCTQI